MTLVLAAEGGTVSVPDAVLVDIAVRAAQGVPGVRVRRRRAIDLEAGVVRLSVAAAQGEPLVEVAERAQAAAADALRAMCGLEAKVDIHVAELQP